MMKKTVRIVSMTTSETRERIVFWQSKKISERLDAVEELRRQRHGISAGFLRSVKIIQRKKS